MVRILIVVGLVLLSLEVEAAPPCNTRDFVTGYLAEKYHERPVATGITNTGTLVEVFVQEDGKTWTIMITHPSGISCMIAAGEAWRKIEFELEPNA